MVGERGVSAQESNLLALVATVSLIGLLLGVAYFGFLYGRESGMCSARCTGATQGHGSDHYYGGTCHCIVNGQEVHPL